MASRERTFSAFCVLCAGTIVGWSLLSPENPNRSDALQLGFDSLALELWLGSLALALALTLPGRVDERLGLVSTRFSGLDVAVLAFGTLALSHGIDAILTLTGAYEHSALPDLTRPLAGARGPELIVVLIGLGLAPGFCEELLCRGLVQRAAIARLGTRAGVLLAALTFGALHVEPIHAVSAVVIGVYLGWLAHRGASTLPAMVCHAVNNSAAVLGASFPEALPHAPWASAPLGLAVAVACLGWTARRVPAGGRSPLPLQPHPESVEG